MIPPILFMFIDGGSVPTIDLDLPNNAIGEALLDVYTEVAALCVAREALVAAARLTGDPLDDRVPFSTSPLCQQALDDVMRAIGLCVRLYA